MRSVTEELSLKKVEIRRERAVETLPANFPLQGRNYACLSNHNYCNSITISFPPAFEETFWKIKVLTCCLMQL